MSLAKLWTCLMTVAIAIYAAALFIGGCGGGILAWLLAPVGVFVGFHLVPLPIVLLCGIAERFRMVRASWRAELHGVLLVGLLILLGWNVLPSPVSIAALGFSGAMYLVRIVFYSRWRPGQPVELGS